LGGGVEPPKFPHIRPWLLKNNTLWRRCQYFRTAPMWIIVNTYFPIATCLKFSFANEDMLYVRWYFPAVTSARDPSFSISSPTTILEKKNNRMYQPLIKQTTWLYLWLLYKYYIPYLKFGWPFLGFIKSSYWLIRRNFISLFAVLDVRK